MWLFILFLALPLVEIALFVLVGGWIGLWPTLALVVLAGILGLALVRGQGLRAAAQLQGALAGPEDPAETLVQGAMILLAGLLFLLPGFFSDALGFLLLVPAVRARAFLWLRRRMVVQGFGHGHPRGPGRRRPEIIEGEFEVISPDDRPARGGPGWTRH